MASLATQHHGRDAHGTDLTRREFLAVAAGGVGLASGINATAGNALPHSVTSDSSALHYSSLAAVAKLIETKQVSPLEVTKCLLDRIAAVDGRLYSYAASADGDGGHVAPSREPDCSQSNHSFLHENQTRPPRRAARPRRHARVRS